MKDLPSDNSSGEWLPSRPRNASDNETNYESATMSTPESLSPTNSFTEYLWMENEKEFDDREMKRLEEEEIMKICIEAMWEDELEAIFKKMSDKTTEIVKKEDRISTLVTLKGGEVVNSTLNPQAKEFVPIGLCAV